MDRFFIGVIFGIALATVGMSGIAKVVDKGIDVVKEQSREYAK